MAEPEGQLCIVGESWAHKKGLRLPFQNRHRPDEKGNGRTGLQALSVFNKC